MALWWLFEFESARIDSWIILFSKRQQCRWSYPEADSQECL